jgi:class 3 adenylate cyclase/tetratricopeptide (TPR) repeat protein
VKCGACGVDLPEGARFCNQCGQPVGASPAAAPHGAAPQFVSPAAYTPRHLAERILTSRSAIEGERKQVTVLFVDVVESSTLAEGLDPELMHEIMDRVFRLMAGAVHRYEGTVNQFLGDGLMALFGAPLALEDHALRAIQAALAIRETVGGYSEQLKQQRGVEIRLRLGLNSGPVVVGKIGDDLRMDYTAVGDTTHLAARMQTLAEPGTILVTDAAHRLVEGYVLSEPLGPVEVKGRSEAVPVFRVTGRRRRSRFEVSAERGLTELIGRERELVILQDCLTRAKAGRGHVVGIVGEPGVGKSRLLYEFRQSVRDERVTWLEGQCAPYGQTTPLLPLLEILSANFRIEDGDNPLQIEEKIRQGLRRLDVGLERILPFLSELFGLPATDETLKHLDPRDKRQKTFEAVRALTFAGSQRRPHVVIFEDLQWIDRTTEDYLASMIDSLAAAPLLLLTTHRPGYTVRWADKTYYRQIVLDVLGETDVEAMVGRLLGTRDVSPDLVRRIQEKAEGNPLFVEVIITSLRERGLLVRKNGGFVWSKGRDIEFPGTLQDIVRARLDRLDDPVKRTVQTAAVIGRAFGLNVLRRVSEVAQEVEAYLETLKRLELIYETRRYPEVEYTFKHAVVQDAAYQSLLGQRRKELHRVIGRALEALYADRLEDQAPILAYHYARSDRQDRAVEYALLAGDRAARFYANADATTYYEQALTMARALPRSPDAQRAEIDAILKLAGVAVTRQDMERDLTNLEAARARAEQLQDPSRLARSLYWLARVQYVLGNPRAAIEYSRRSLDIAESMADDGLAAPPVNLMGRVYWQLCDLEKSCQLLERSAEQMLRLGNKNDAATTAGFAGIALAERGEFERAYALTDQGLRLANEIQNPFALGAAHFFRGFVRAQRGEWSSAIHEYREARGFADRVADLFRVYVTKCWEGEALVMAGDPRHGRALVQEGIAVAEQIGTKFLVGRAKVRLAVCLLALGDLESVAPLCEEAVGLADGSGDRFAVALAHRTRAEASLRLDPSNRQKAEDAMLQAIRIQQEIGARPELARSNLTYALMLETSGESERAREFHAKAITMFREMGMAWDLERAMRTLGQL